MQEMKVWYDQGSTWNFKQKLTLMEAEEYFSNGNFQLAKESYQKAITCSRSNNSINDEALSCELAARFYSETGNQTQSLAHFTMAREKYIKWGATGKANHISSMLINLASDLINNLQDNNLSHDHNTHVR
jgi:tetratricopeptide (TPR) repeat protein